jgi:hypothetical protein
MVEKGRIFLKFGLTFSNINAEPINQSFNASTGACWKNTNPVIQKSNHPRNQWLSNQPTLYLQCGFVWHLGTSKNSQFIISFPAEIAMTWSLDSPFFRHTFYFFKWTEDPPNPHRACVLKAEAPKASAARQNFIGKRVGFTCRGHRNRHRVCSPSQSPQQGGGHGRFNNVQWSGLRDCGKACVLPSKLGPTISCHFFPGITLR